MKSHFGFISRDTIKIVMNVSISQIGVTLTNANIRISFGSVTISCCDFLHKNAHKEIENEREREKTHKN